MMHFIVKPSLEHIALVKIATTLWNQPDIRSLVASCMRDQVLNYEYDAEWKRNRKILEDTVMKKASDISIPDALKQKLLHFTKQIGLQIFNWLKYHKKYVYTSIDLPREFCWTPMGTINLKKTAEKVINDEDTEVTTRYKLACFYCFEDDIPEVWSKVPEYHRRCLYERDPVNVEQHIFWAYYMQRSLGIWDYFYKVNEILPYDRECLFELAAVRGNKATVEYLLQKITPTKRKENLKNTLLYIGYEYERLSDDIPKEYLTDVLCFLLSKFSENKQIKLIVLHIYKLDFFLFWPWQSLFFEAACRAVGFYCEKPLCSFLLGIVNHIKEYNNDKYYKKFICLEIFANIWRPSYSYLKVHMLNVEAYMECILTSLFEVGQLETISSILEDVTLLESEKFVPFDWIKKLCISLIMCEKWDLLEFIIQGNTSSKENVLKLEREILEHVEQRIYDGQVENIYKRNVDKIFRL